ncbi:MAG: Serine/threonine-protein kinase PrkC [Verrucomicrobia subdivision 3 bacterium]|nr:Serine/threonine-protein kinase PrkC [Limisphaerales bacterium]MCS1415379.1 Serine/threonine-protein kinase PrkC [Limisphaerales bacterium]
MQQLFQEARARVDHPNVIRIYFADKSQGMSFFAMELINGPRLKELLGDGQLLFSDVVRVGLWIAGALQYMLRRDIVHGDIKPSNIFTKDRFSAA